MNREWEREKRIEAIYRQIDYQRGIVASFSKSATPYAAQTVAKAQATIDRLESELASIRRDR